MDELRTPEKALLNAAEVAQLLGVKKCMAYKVIRECNKELSEMGKLAIRGKVNKRYLLQKLEV